MLGWCWPWWSTCHYSLHSPPELEKVWPPPPYRRTWGRANGASALGTEPTWHTGPYGKCTEAPNAIGNSTSGFLEVLFKAMAKPQNAFPVVPGVVQGSIPLRKYGVGITDLCLGSSKGSSITAPPSLAVTCWKLHPETKQYDLGYVYSEVSTMVHDTHNCNPGRSSDLG